MCRLNLGKMISIVINISQATMRRLLSYFMFFFVCLFVWNSLTIKLIYDLKLIDGFKHIYF